MKISELLGQLVYVLRCFVRSFFSSLYYTDDTSYVSTENEEQESKTGQETRLSEIALNDAIHKVDFPWYFQNQVCIHSFLCF